MTSREAVCHSPNLHYIGFGWLLYGWSWGEVSRLRTSTGAIPRPHLTDIYVCYVRRSGSVRRSS
jgi:hypothetical protein